MRKFTLYLFILFIATACSNKNELNLAGEWSVVLKESSRKDSLFKPNRGLGPTQNVMYQPTILNEKAKVEGIITLPGTLDEYGFGNEVEEPFLGCLSRKTKFIGNAIYSRKIKTTEQASWKITFERVLWKSTLKIDGQEIGSCESLSTPHTFIIKNLPAGNHAIEVNIDNTMIHRIGEKGHAYGEHMQTIWNGILGEMVMQKIDVPTLENIRINAPFTRDIVQVFFNSDSIISEVNFLLKDKKTGNVIIEKNVDITKNLTQNTISVPLQPEKITAWDEFNPQLYTLELRKKDVLLLKENIGFRSFKREGNQLFINGEPLFLRGNLDNCHFPLTGYPSMKKEDWLKIFSIQKNYGCNNIRFHSYCPPKAAFEAADELGLYLAPEVGIWIDGWMPGQITPLGMSNYSLNSYIKTELNNICNAYSTHASFAMLGIGNELGSSNFDSLQLWVDEIKQAESFENNSNWQSRLYTISTARTLTSVDDFFVTHHYPNIGGVRQWMFPYTAWNYENLYAKTETPTIAHEIGQWPVYPNWNEIKKYTGVLAPHNLVALKQHAKENGVLQFNDKFHFASGMQSKLMYKDEIESFMRTPSCRGIHLLGMQDYSGQGEALIGFLDSFYEPKGFWSAKDARGCFSSIVTLAEFEKYGWRTSETFTAKLLARNQKCDLNNVQIKYEITDVRGNVVKEGKTSTRFTKNGDLTDFGNISIDLESFANDKLTLTTELISGDNVLSEKNSWSFWIFPEQEIKIPSNTLLTSNLSAAIEAAKKGGKVILDASKLGNENMYLKGDWGSVYWSTTWFPGQQMQTLGVWMDKSNPIFDAFHNEGFADWIWWKIFEKGRCFDLKGLSKDYYPIAMPVPDFHNNQRLGSIFELKIGEGKLLISGYALDGNSIEQIVFRNQLIKYVESENFSPQEITDEAWLNNLLNPNATVQNTDLPEEFRNALLYIECGGKATETTSWNTSLDKVFVTEHVGYEVDGFTINQVNNTFTWTTTSNNEIIINTPAGELGLLHVDFLNKNASGIIEGRKFDSENKNFVALPIDREDCLDGKLRFRVNATKNNPISIKRVIFIPVKK